MKSKKKGNYKKNLEDIVQWSEMPAATTTDVGDIPRSKL